MTAPYYPPLLSQPIINPRVGGFIRPVPYLSPSEYRYAPTAMDTESLDTLANAVLGEPSEQDQIQVLSNVIARVSGWINTYCFGVEEASKGASLCASQSVEDLDVLPLQRRFCLQCSYWPILQLDACAFGPDPSDLETISQETANKVRFGKHTIYVPLTAGFVGTGPSLIAAPAGPTGKTYAVWTYTAGFPHLELSGVAEEGESTVDVIPNGPSNSVLGVYPGDVLSIDDYSYFETITVESIEGTTINTASPLQSTHTAPEGPDFIAVSALPGDVQQAAIFLTTAFIKSRGDLSLTIDGVNEPTSAKNVSDDVWQDVKWGLGMLANYRVPSKVRS